MYELSRARLYSVGPPGARYEDVTIDLSGAGDPVRDQQLMLGRPEVRRPSPASILFLENGGGKSVLIKLIFSVVLPGRRQVVGTSNTKVLENFVGRDDVAHVVLEWMHTKTGRRLLTGKVSDWRGRSPQSGEDNLVDSWYTLRPNGTVDIMSLPFAENGQNLVATEYRSRLDDLADNDATLELDWADKHWKWSERLSELGLDPELFRYQRTMNAGEGEAADTFTFATDEAFVDFLLKAVLPAGEQDDLADSVAGHAEKLAERGELELERTFVAEVIEHLDPLTEQRAIAERAAATAKTATGALDAFVERLIARIDHESGLLSQRKEHIDELATAVAEAERDLREAQNLKAALVHRTRTLRFTAACEAETAADKALSSAERVLQGWGATSKLIAYENAKIEASQLRAVVDRSQDAARAALEVRDAQARALGRALLSTLDNASVDANREDAEIEKLQKSAASTNKSWRSAVDSSAQASALAAQLDKHIADVDADIGKAVRDGLITSAASLASDAASCIERVRNGAADLEDANDQLATLDDEVDEARAALLQAGKDEVAARSDLNGAQAKLTRAETATGELAREPRLAELLDTDDVLLEYDAETLLDQLARAQNDIDRRRIDVRVTDAADEPARLIWEDDPEALLPPHHEVTHIRDLLKSAGIECWTGWDYLAERSDESVRAEIVQRLPHLAGGVLVNRPDHVERARDVLEKHGYHPSGTVIVATPQSFDVAVDANYDLSLKSSAGFVTPPNPALFDQTAARDERSRIASEHAERDAELVALNIRYHADQALAARLTAWRSEYPTGALAELAAAVSSAQATWKESDETVRRCDGALSRVSEARDTLKRSCAEMIRTLEVLRERSRHVAELAQRGRDAETARREANQARVRSGAEDAHAEKLLTLLDKLREDINAHVRRADGHRAVAARAKEDIAHLPGGVVVNRDDSIPGQPVAVLRDALQKAEKVCIRVEVGDKQLDKLRQAEEKVVDTRKVWEAEPDAVRRVAQDLIHSSDAADAASRAAAISQASTAVQAADQAHLAAVGERAVWDARLRELGSPATVLDLLMQPQDAEHGERLIEETAATILLLEEIHSGHRADLDTKRRELDSAEAVTESFRTIRDTHLGTLEEQPEIDLTGVEPFGGNAESARRQYGELGRAATTAQKTAQDAQRTLRNRAEQLNKYAAEVRFQHLSIPVRTLILGVEISVLADHAAAWSQQLHPRLRSLTDDLAQIDRHRTVIVERLVAIVDGALRRLRTAQRLSKLPDGLGDWTGLEFLRIGCTPAQGDMLNQQLSQVLDEAVERYKTTRKCDGLGIVLRAVRASVPRGFRVTMLKPDAVLREERVRISEVRDVFSGGQHLTAAIILYCTLAALRANDLGRTRHHHSGVLFLDNPIGRASAGYLLDLQRGVAAALGVQLVYTTGLFEEEAIGGFPLIVRLRNDAALRAGRRYLSVSERIARHLDALAPPDDTGVLSTTRIILPERRRDDAE